MFVTAGFPAGQDPAYRAAPAFYLYVTTTYVGAVGRSGQISGISHGNHAARGAASFAGRESSAAMIRWNWMKAAGGQVSSRPT
jgi:hypothetical protein